jgi:integrase/recombinase XerD
MTRAPAADQAATSAAVTSPPRRTPPKRKARQLAKHLREERPDYTYLKAVFRALRAELDVEVQRQPKTLPYVPSEDEIRRYYQAVWQARRSGDMVLIKTLLYAGVRVAELVGIRIEDVDLDAARIRISHGKGGKGRVVPFPHTFRETLALHITDRHKTGGQFLFESSWKKPYSTRGVRALLARYATAAGLPHNMPPHRLRHFLFTWLKTQGIDDALIQPYSGHASRQSLEIYSRLALTDAQASYDQAIGRFPV